MEDLEDDDVADPTCKLLQSHSQVFEIFASAAAYQFCLNLPPTWEQLLETPVACTCKWDMLHT